jgi:hypothetical protein
MVLLIRYLLRLRRRRQTAAAAVAGRPPGR